MARREGNPDILEDGGERRRATIHDVARECGVSLSTVSNALAGKSNVREETRQRVLATAERLGYRASMVARALRMQRSFTIGVLIADVANPASPDFVRGIEDMAVRETCTLLLCNTDGDETRQIAHMRSLLDQQVDGMVLISQYCEGPVVRGLLETGTPFVLLQRRSPLFADDYVGADNFTGITESMRHLIELGHRRIAFVRGPFESSTAQERFDAYLHNVAGFGLDSDPELVCPGHYSVEGGYAAAMRFLALDRPPTAILASNDMSAMGVLNATAERGIDVPSQLSLVGFDDIQLASFARINLTTTHLPKRDMGAAAAGLLMNRIDSKEQLSQQTVIFPTRLVVRGTTGPVRTARPRIRIAARSHRAG
ncbi:LacI family DNA-binding transcriptional regulator [Azospirillum sp. HJ39]|uniref:LacI family DNA-binding transcriptional regulator n=1 Tax=Azospirillum sp. HJ39 TaxID=3159496 RepID=UPI0035560C78